MSAFTTLYAGRNVSRTVNDQSRPLTESQLHRAAPSLFAADKHESRSQRYTYIPTIEILRGLMKEGYMPVAASQGRTRVAGKEMFTKHMVRMRREQDLGVRQTEAKEVILLNSHDGTSSYQLMQGVFRFVCSNGMVRADLDHDIKVPHKGDIMGEVLDGCIRVVSEFKQLDASIDAMKSLDMSRDEQMLLATTALGLRFGHNEEGIVQAPVKADALLKVVRLEDRANDLWTTFNVVQENTVRGGLAGRSATGRRLRTRAVTGIDQNVGLNRALFQLAEGFKQLKTTGRIEGLQELVTA